jgi:hypothetical protein
MSDRIPNTCHFVFGFKKQTEPFHLVYYLCLESCRRILAPDRIILYYNHEPYGEYWERIRDKLELVRMDPVEHVSRFRYGFKNRWSKKYRYAHHADFIRLERLVEHGGIYADIDTIFVDRIPDALWTKPFVLGREHDVRCQTTGEIRPSLCNALIMSRKGAEFGARWLDEMTHAFDGSWSNHSTLLPQKLSERYPERVHIEPPTTFYKYMWTKEDLHRLLEGCETGHPGVVSIHLWSHLWWARRRRDFSSFFGDMITEDYVRRVNTTYNLLARPFLPE